MKDKPQLKEVWVVEERGSLGDDDTRYCYDTKEKAAKCFNELIDGQNDDDIIDYVKDHLSLDDNTSIDDMRETIKSNQYFYRESDYAYFSVYVLEIE